jgi:hypothetical protein
LLVANLTLAKDPLYELAGWVKSLDLRALGYNHRSAGPLSDDGFARALVRCSAVERLGDGLGLGFLWRVGPVKGRRKKEECRSDPDFIRRKLVPSPRLPLSRKSRREKSAGPVRLRAPKRHYAGRWRHSRNPENRFGKANGVLISLNKSASAETWASVFNF